MSKCLAIFASGRGSNFKSVVDHVKLGILQNVEVGLLIYNNPDAPVAKVADSYGVKKELITQKDRLQFDREAIKMMTDYGADFGILAGFTRILGVEIVETFRWRIMNIHPSILPSFGGKGMYGDKVHRAVLESGAAVTGATVHYIDVAVDRGPIILQEPVMIEGSDKELFLKDQLKGVENLSSKVLMQEHRLYPKAIQLHVEDRLKVRSTFVKTDEGEFTKSIVVADYDATWDRNWKKRQEEYIRLFQGTG